MAISVNKRPYSICFSGNPVHYELASQLAAGDSEIFFEVRLMFKTVGGVYAPTESLPYSPINGVAELDVQDILEGLLEYELPQFSGDEKDPWPATKQTGFFYLQYREVTAANPNPSWDDAELNYEILVVKGGLSRFAYQGNNYWVNYYNAPTPLVPRPFLTWQKRGRLAGITERMYLAYLLIDDVAALVAKAKVTYVDGTTDETTEVALPADKNRITFIPAGAFQLGLDVLDAGKVIHYWEIWVEGDGGRISEIFRYVNDQRPDYNEDVLNYRGSLGGLDSMRLLGVRVLELEYEYQEQARTVSPDYFDGHFYEPLVRLVNNKELQVRLGSTGALDREECDRLRDAFVIRETWKAKGNKWLPVNMITKENRQESSEFGLARWALQVAYVLAHEGDYYYTPESEDLGAGSFVSNSCLAYLSPLSAEVDLSGVDALITLNGEEVDPQDASAQFQYRLKDELGAVVADWETHNYADLPLQFTMPKDVVYTLEARSVCTNNVYGRTVTLQIDSNAGAPPPGGNPGGNSVIKNDSSFIHVVNVWVNNVKVVDSVIVGSNNRAYFDTGDAVNAEVIVEITSGFSPSGIFITSSAVAYYPSGVTPPNSWVFDGVNILGGMLIVIS